MAVACVVTLIFGTTSTPPNTKIAPGATQATYVKQGNAICSPLVKLLRPRAVNKQQLLIVRTEVEELAKLEVPVQDRVNVNVLLGLLASYGDTYAQSVAQRTGRTPQLALIGVRADRLFVQLGLTHCSI